MNFFSLSNPVLWISIALSFCNGVLLCFLSAKLLQILQLSSYKMAGYQAWLKDTKAKFFSQLVMLSFLSFVSMLVFKVVTDKVLYVSYASIIFYLWFSLIVILNSNKAPKKTPLVSTKRIQRITIVLFLLIAIFTFALIYLATKYLSLVSFVIISVVPIFLVALVPIANGITYPLEILIAKKYIKLAKKELSKHKNLIKIGITGSYGKTSTKYILNKMLAEKFNVCMSPFSFNTPMGLTKVILKYLKDDHEILIAEMGAKKQGEIKELCEIIQPDYGIITAIGEQHLNTFGSLENIKKTKNELSQCVKKENFVAFFGDNKNTMELFEKRDGKKMFASVFDENAYAYAFDIAADENGSKFKLKIGKNVVECKTKLLGKHNIQNIVLSASVAHKLGVEMKDINNAISLLEPVPHRLELKHQNNITIIDNSYNSSVDGVKASLETLSLFKGRKIVVTPGLIELGKKEYNENFKLGQELSKVADIVIIVNKTNEQAIKEGLLDEKFKEKNIYFAERLNDIFVTFKSLIKKEDIILFENDLPDNYI